VAGSVGPVIPDEKQIRPLSQQPTEGMDVQTAKEYSIKLNDEKA
jgi:hypothetical protein